MSNLVKDIPLKIHNRIRMRKNSECKCGNPVLLKAENLHKVYRKGQQDIHAVKGVTLDIKKGDITVIVGPSGAGKSTLLHLLGGLDRPTKGTIYLNGLNLYSLRDSRRSRIRNEKIGFVFQFYHLLPEFTALENVMLPALIRGGEKKSFITNKASVMLNRVGLKGRINHKPSELSGGESQRVAIARALINDPDIVLCDEPTGNLDSATSSEICALIKELNTDMSTSFVIATHETSLAERATKVLNIKDGSLQ